MPEDKIRKLRKNLLRWYRRHKRALPWRSHPSPYRVWVAEIMLQQTRVQTVLPYYRRFLRRFSGMRALAAASEKEVLELWAGLGYYRRARNLRRAAIQIMAEAGGKFPETLEAILRLPGVGRYTACAIQSIAFHQPQPVVDGNVVRVISRVNGIEAAPAGYFWKQAESWLVRRAPADFNQAMMELGALVCLPSGPRCGQCPLSELCTSARGMPAARVRKRPTRPQENVELIMLVVESGGQVLLERRRETGYIPGEWGLPIRILAEGDRPFDVAKSLARSIFRSALALVPSGAVRHAITHRDIVAHVVRAVAADPKPPSG
jgi:A/G-specific adenine glycosylase